MKALAQQDRNILEMSLLSFNQVSRPETKRGSLVKMREKSSQQNKANTQAKINIDLNVPGMCKHIIQVIEENINESDLLLKTLSNRDNVESCKKQNKKIPGLDWFEIDTAWPIKNGLYYVTDGIGVAVSFFDKEKQVFYVLKKLEIKYWSPAAVTLLQ